MVGTIILKNITVGQSERVTCRQKYAIWRVLSENSAAAIPVVSIDVNAGLWIARINIVRCQQTMSLRANVTHLQDQVPGQFAFDTQVVLDRVLRPHILREFTKQKYRPEYGPIHRLARRGTLNSR